MVQWGLSPSGGERGERPRHDIRSEIQRLLPIHDPEAVESAFPAIEVTKVALRLKYQVEQVIPCELEISAITKANSPIITQKVIRTAKGAGGEKYSSCVVYCLLVCKKWFRRLSIIDLPDADLHHARAVACEVLAKRVIEDEEDEDFLMQEMLLKRFSTVVHGQETMATNTIERAVDLHALLVIGSSGYQKCLHYLWRGWLVQDDADPLQFVPYKHKANPSYWVHFDPDRMRAPTYQNAVQISFSFIYLILYTIAINTINDTGDLDFIEGILYLFTAGFVFDEVSKVWKIGWNYIAFWNVFNSTLYVLLLISFVTRMIALSNDIGSDMRISYNQLSYDFLAFSAPMFWMRLLLYLDTFRFFGAMIVVLKVMMKESIIFFALLTIIGVGFFQAFIGLNSVDDDQSVTTFIVQSMANSLMASPNFEGFEQFAHPFGIILYYIFTFIVMVVLLNILVALYNSAYQSITDNATDEYMALFAYKTMQFVRAPDENVFIPPFNLIEVFLLILPFEWWLPRSKYAQLNNYVMLILYAPLLLVTSWFEQRSARAVLQARQRGDADDDTVEEWEQLLATTNATNDNGQNGQNGGGGGEEDFFGIPGWKKSVEGSRPNVQTDAAVLEIRDLKTKVETLTALVERLAAAAASKDKNGAAAAEGGGGGGGGNN